MAYTKRQVARAIGIRPGTFKTNLVNGHYTPIIGEVEKDSKGHRYFTQYQMDELLKWYSDKHVAIRCISLGGGVQSTTIVLMHLLEGAFDPKPNLAVFLDLGWESENTYRNIEKLTRKAAEAGFEVQTVGVGNIRDDILSNTLDKTKRLHTPPMFFRNKEGKKAQIARECTATYKIERMQAHLKRRLGIPQGMVMRWRAETWIGISTDEAQRMNSGNNPAWISVKYPLIDLGMSRDDCKRKLAEYGWDEPAKSSCLGCPFKPNSEWKDMKENRPEEWANVIQIDEAVRGGVNNITGQVFLHQSLRPLQSIDFGQAGRGAMYDECSGYCHT